MLVYEPGPDHDLLALRWWDEMLTSGELEPTFGRSALSLSKFMQMLATPYHQTFLEIDAKGVCFGFNLTPFLSGAFVILWVAPRARRAKHLVPVIEQAYEAAFTGFPILLGVTRQERHLAVHRHWGYTVAGVVPALWEGHDVWLVSLTETAYLEAKEQRHGAEHWRRGRRELLRGEHGREGRAPAGSDATPERRADDPEAGGTRPEGTPLPDA